MADIYQSIDSLDEAAVQKIVDRLEFRAADPVFVAMRERYFDKLNLRSCRKVLDLGCGTGVVTRALMARLEFEGSVTGIDFSVRLIEAAERLAAEAGLDERISFTVGDSHGLEGAESGFDAVLAHTLVSHVTDPSSVVAEIARVLAPDGLAAIFDGDYASLTLGAGDRRDNATMVAAMLETIVANPYVLREMPALLQKHGLEVVGFFPEIHAEAGKGGFFLNMSESYAPMAVAAGAAEAEFTQRWLDGQRKAAGDGTFFGACNFYTYLVRKTR